MSVTARDEDAVTMLGVSAIRMRLLRLLFTGYLIERQATHPRGSGDVIYWGADRERVIRTLWYMFGTVVGYPPAPPRADQPQRGSDVDGD